MDYTNIIGEKIKSLRSIKEISIEELAESTGLTTDQITRIEENIDIPSLAPLIKIARALGVRLGTFLDDQDSESGPVVCRKGEADDTISFSNNATDSRQHMHYHSLSGNRVRPICTRGRGIYYGDERYGRNNIRKKYIHT